MKCFLHDFETGDIEKWDRHCYYTGHMNSVTEFINGKYETVKEPYPRHFMRDEMIMRDAMMIEETDEEYEDRNSRLQRES